MMEEWIARGRESVLGKVSELCNKYDLPDVALQPVDADLVRETIREKCRIDLWADAISSRIVKSSDDIDVITKLFWTMPRSQTRALLFYKTGALKAKETWKVWNSTKYGNILCPVPDCGENDTADHVLLCKGYDANAVGGDVRDAGDMAIADRLVKINNERVTKYRMSLL